MKTTSDNADNLSKNGDYRKALQNYLDLLQQDPDDGKTYQGIAYSYYRLRNYDNAVSACNKAIALAPDLAIPHTILAYIYHLRRDLDQALAEALKAYELSPGSDEVNHCYGVLLLDKGRFEEGISVLNRALEINPTLAAAHYNLALAYGRAGRNKKSLEEMKIYFNDKPTLRRGMILLRVYEQRYALLLTIIALAALFGSIFIKSKALLIFPSILIIQVWLNCYQLLKQGRWKDAFLSFVSVIPVAIIIYYFYVALTPR